MIQAANFPIIIRRGDTGTWKFEINDLNEYGQSLGAIDITNWEFVGKVKYDQNTVWFTFPIVKTDAPNGKWEFYIDKDTSEGLIPVGSPPPDSASYEVQVTVDNTGTGGNIEVATIMIGTFSVIRDLVR
jgi:hypothetical protein